MSGQYLLLNCLYIICINYRKIFRVSMFSKNRQRKLPKFKLCVSKKSINTGFVWLGKVRMKTAIFDLIREIQGMSGKFVNLSGIFFVGEILSLFCILVSFNPNIIVLCNHHFANHENIVLWLYYQHGYQFLNSLNSLNCSEFFFATWNILEKVTFSDWFLNCSEFWFFDKILSPLNQEILKRLRKNYLYSFNQGKVGNNLNNNLSNNNYEQQKFVSFVFII